MTMPLTAVPADGQFGQPRRDPQDRSKPKAKAPEGEQDAAADNRLAIRPALQGGQFVYAIHTLADGRVLAQIPQAEVEALALRPDYRSGQVIDTRA